MIDFVKYEEAAQAIEQDILAKELPMECMRYGIEAPLERSPRIYEVMADVEIGVCAIGCYLVGRELAFNDELDSAAYHLGVKRGWLEGVIQGFDGGTKKLGCGTYEEATLFRHGHQVGQHLREKYLTLDQQYLVPPGGLKGP